MPLGFFQGDEVPVSGRDISFCRSNRCGGRGGLLVLLGRRGTFVFNPTELGQGSDGALVTKMNHKFLELTLFGLVPELQFL